MHFSKSYAQILLSLPPELGESAISYRQLKKLIHQVIKELTVLGFGPEVVRNLVSQGNGALHTIKKNDNPDEHTAVATQSHTTKSFELLYEVGNDLGHLVPRLRLIVGGDIDTDTTLHFPALASSGNSLVDPSGREYIIPLASDTAFFNLLTSDMKSLSAKLDTVRSEFMADLEDLSKSISNSALPISQTESSYRPFSVNDDPGMITIPPTKAIFRPGLDSRSDLYLWRKLLDLYLEAEVFDSISERDRGERSLEDTKIRMANFLERVEKNGILHGKSKKAHLEVERFLKLNYIILDLKKLNRASSEATRKILKKHAKRTALPFPPSLPREIVSVVIGPPSTGQMSRMLIPLPYGHGSLPQLLVQAIGDTILPIIPHVEDYSCIICTSIAFKPIRLSCGHLFCVRCLVKMQKQGKSNCPVCRSPCVLTANRSNVDLALMNFMADWFPVESREKMQSNEREVNDELTRELGLDNTGCSVM